MTPTPNRPSAHAPDPLALSELETLALAAAQAGAAVLVKSFRRERAWVRTKSSSTDMVSDADARAQAAVISRLRRARPEDGLLAEESAEVLGSSGLRWVVDPLDGTTNFLYGLPTWGVSVAVEDVETARMLAGAVVDPMAGEAFSAHLGGGARRWTPQGGREPIRPTPAGPELRHSLIATGFAYDADRRRAQGAKVAELLSDVRDIRRVGAASIDLCWTAAGRFDAYFEEGLKPWDFAAGALVAEEAGCVVLMLGPDASMPRPVLLAGRRQVVEALSVRLGGTSVPPP